METVAKKNYQYQYSSPESAPETLRREPFYGLRLDEEQEVFRDLIYDKNKIAILCNSKAGTGKTTIALGTANLLVQYGFYNGIVYIVSPTMEQKQGFLPGSPEEKTAPYMEPLLDAMLSLGIPSSALMRDEDMESQKNGNAYIQFLAHTYLRGCNFEHKVIIVEESQNFYFDELKKVLTRIHDNCKVIVIGHTEQCDLYKNAQKSGFKYYLEAFRNIEDDRVGICELTVNHRGWFSSFCDNVTCNM